MKLLAFSDSHGDPKALKEIAKKIKREKPDILICCGDITIFGDHLEQKLEKINSFSIPCYIIHGNHEELHEFSVLCKQFEHLHFIHNETVLLQDHHVVNDAGKNVPVRLYGLGGDGFSRTNKEFKKQTKKWLKERSSEEFHILLTHAPPYETALDIVETGEHSGNKDIKEFIINAKVEVAFSGHIHETAKVTEVLHSYSLLINPGPDGMILTL